jgi:hypothetical protein
VSLSWPTDRVVEIDHRTTRHFVPDRSAANGVGTLKLTTGGRTFEIDPCRFGLNALQ